MTYNFTQGLFYDIRYINPQLSQKYRGMTVTTHPFDNWYSGMTSSLQSKFEIKVKLN